MTPCIKVYAPVSAPIRALFLLAAMGGCGHTDPFASPPYGTDAPFDPTPPRRLTLNSLADRGAAWLPDGSGILYSAQQLGRADHDLCLAQLPPTGGRQSRLTCDLSAGGVDSANAIESAAPSIDGRLAFVEASAPIGASGTLNSAIAIAPTFDPVGASKVQRIPYTIPGQPAHGSVAALRWLGASRLVFVGGKVGYLNDCFGCPLDTLFAGLEVVVLDVAGGATPSAVPGTSSPPAYPPAPATMRSSTLWRVTRASTGARSPPATSRWRTTSALRVSRGTCTRREGGWPPW